MKSYKGKFKPKNPKKYMGNPNNIIYRSLWERKFLIYCDLNENVIGYASEEIPIRYYDPTTKKVRRYYPDMFVKIKQKNGSIKKLLIEIKPKKQTVEPKVPKRKTKSYLYEQLTYIKNQSKWEAAREFCLDNGLEFKIMTEDDLGIK